MRTQKVFKRREMMFVIYTRHASICAQLPACSKTKLDGKHEKKIVRKKDAGRSECRYFVCDEKNAQRYCDCRRRMIDLIFFPLCVTQFITCDTKRTQKYFANSTSTMAWRDEHRTLFLMRRRRPATVSGQ